MGMVFDNMPASVQFFTTAIAGQAKTCHDGLFHWEDKFRILIGTDVDGFLAFSMTPQIVDPDGAIEIISWQFMGIPETA